jgi:hypothetical protein
MIFKACDTCQKQIAKQYNYYIFVFIYVVYKESKNKEETLHSSTLRILFFIFFERHFNDFMINGELDRDDHDSIPHNCDREGVRIT